MKELIRFNNVTIEQFNNGAILTTRPFPPTLGRERNIFMPEPGNGEIPIGNVPKPPEAPKPEATRPVSPERVAKARELWGRFYLKGRGLSSLPHDERQAVETAIKLGLPPIAGGQDEQPTEAGSAGDLPPPPPPEAPPTTPAGEPEETPTTAEGAGEEGPPRREDRIMRTAAEFVSIIGRGTPDTYVQTFAQIEGVIDSENSNDRDYGYVIKYTMEALRSDTEHVREIDYFLEYAMERILTRADVNPKAQYPQFTLEEQLNLGDILAYARIYDSSIPGRTEGAEGTIFKYLNDLSQRRQIMHELFRNMKDRRTYVSYITQNLRKEGLAFVEKQIAGVADSQIIYEKFLGDALSQKRGWLTSDDIEAVDRNVEGFMTRNAAQFSKEIKDENGNVIDSRLLRPWELKRAAIVGKSLNAAMQRRLVYTVMGDVPVHDITTLLDSVDSEELARILAPMKLITERFLGIDTNTKKIFIEEVLRKTKELGDAKEQQYGYGARDADAAGNRKGLYGKRENSWAILDTGITDPKSNGWRGSKIFLMQKDYRTETLGGQTMGISIGEYLDQVKGEDREAIKQELTRRYPHKNPREIDDIIGSSRYDDELRGRFNRRVREVIQRQRLFLGPLLQMGGLNWENKRMVWEKVADFLPSRIAAFFPEETIEKIQDVYGFRPAQNATAEQRREARVRALEIWNGNGTTENYGLKTKLYLAESRRVKDDAETLKNKTWEEVEEENLKSLSDYFDEAGITDPDERLVIENITALGKDNSGELAKIKFPYTPFLDDVPKTDWENIEDFSYDRILVYDHSDFDAGYKAIIGLMGKPVVEPKTVVAAFAEAKQKFEGPIGLRASTGGAQGVLEKYINAYLSMARENELAKLAGPIMKITRKPRSKMEEGNLQAGVVLNEDFTSSVLQGLAQQDVISDDPEEKDKNGLTQFSKMKKENKADMKWKLYYWARMILLIFGPIAGAEFIKIMLPREAAESVLAGF